MYLFTNPLATGRIWHKVNFLSQVGWFELGVLLRLKSSVCPTIYSQLEEEEMDLCFFEGISMKWNADSLMQDLNLGCQLYFF